MSESRFDFAFIPAEPVADAVRLAELGERLGYRCMWMPDQGFQRDPFCILALAAERTTAMGIGIGITSPWTRLPTQIARGAATVDEIAQGRFRLGLGTGNRAHVLAPLGLSLGNPIQRTQDAIEIIRRLLRGDSVTFEGRYDRLTGVRLDVPAHPNIPMYVGTRGPRTLEMCGRIADGVLVESLFAGDGLRYVRDHIRSGSDQTGHRRPIDIVSWQLVHVTDEDDVRPVLKAHRPWIARAIAAGPPQAMHAIGIDPETVSKVTEAMQRGATEAAVAAVDDDAVRRLMLVGAPKDLILQLERIFERGATTVSVLGIGTSQETAANLTKLAREVIPAFHRAS